MCSQNFVDELTDWAYEYRRPVEIFQRLEYWRGRSRLGHFFNDPKLKKLHEVWVMAYAGMAHELLEKLEADVCVVKEQDTWVDGKVRTSACVTDYQVALVDRLGRAMGREYREVADRRNEVKTPYRPLSIEGVSQRVREGVHKKVQKCYAGQPNLLLNVNLQSNGYSFQQMAAMTQDFAHKFESIWVLCGLVPEHHPDFTQNTNRYVHLPDGYGFIRLHPSLGI